MGWAGLGWPGCLLTINSWTDQALVIDHVRRRHCFRVICQGIDAGQISPPTSRPSSAFLPGSSCRGSLPSCKISPYNASMQDRDQTLTRQQQWIVITFLFQYLTRRISIHLPPVFHHLRDRCPLPYNTTRTGGESTATGHLRPFHKRQRTQSLTDELPAYHQERHEAPPRDELSGQRPRHPSRTLGESQGSPPLVSPPKKDSGGNVEMPQAQMTIKHPDLDAMSQQQRLID